MSKTNKQLRALVEWAKLYADCDSSIKTKIDGKETTILVIPNGLDNEKMLMYVWYKDSNPEIIKEVWEYVFEKNDWFLEQDNWNKNSNSFKIEPQAIERDY